jgi:beta-lactamase class A
MKMFRVRNRASAVAAGVIVSVMIVGLVAYSPGGRARALRSGPPFAADALQTPASEKGGAELTERLRALCERAGGRVGVAVIHVESGRAAAVGGETPLPLYSVFKLPLAIAVLKEVEEGRLRLDQKVRVTPADVAPGSQFNTDLWREPSERTVAELVELTIVRSDNTSSDKLLELVGGPAAVTARMRALGLQTIEVRSSVREMSARRGPSNTGAASDLARLLARLQQGQVLRPPQLRVLLGHMEGAKTGLRRIRGRLPAGAVVADKTGTGADGSATNDVGIITLPGGKGHLAIAVLISGSELSQEAQEKLIAEMARAAYDAHL